MDHRVTPLRGGPVMTAVGVATSTRPVVIPGRGRQLVDGVTGLGPAAKQAAPLATALSGGALAARLAWRQGWSSLNLMV